MATVDLSGPGFPEDGSIKLRHLAAASVDATKIAAGVTLVTPQAAQADTTAADLTALKVDFNALLAKLRAAGIIASS